MTRSECVCVGGGLVKMESLKSTTVGSVSKECEKACGQFWGGLVVLWWPGSGVNRCYGGYILYIRI
jgi:hypothetical protein